MRAVYIYNSERKKTGGPHNMDQEIDSSRLKSLALALNSTNSNKIF